MARRVNKRFLSILITVLLLGAVGALVSKPLFRPRLGDPKKLIAEGDKLIQTGAYDKARDKYLLAVRADAADTEALLKFGDASAKLTPEGQEYLEAAHAAWRKAVALDPKFTPALNRLLDSYWDYIDTIPRTDEQAKVFSICRDLADKLLAVDPGDKRAAARKHIATLRQWLVTSTVPLQDVEKGEAGLTDLTATDPANPEPPYWVAQLKIRQGQDLLTDSQSSAAEAKFGEAAALFDGALKAQPDNGPLHYRAARVFWLLDRFDPRTKDNKADDRYRKRVTEEVDAAQRLTTDKDEVYVDVQLLAEEWYNRLGNRDKARQVVQAFYGAHPDQMEARLAIARVYAADDATRDKAVEILGKAPPDTKGLIGFKLLRQQDLQDKALYHLAAIRMGEYAAAVAARDEAKKKEAEPLVEQAMGKLRRPKSGAPSYYLLALQGRLHQLKGENVEAVKALGEAVQRRPADDGYDTMFYLAQANLAIGQPGPAKPLLEQVVAALPELTPARLLLARLAFQDRDVEATKTHLAALRAQDPENPDVKELDRLVTVLSRKDDPAKSDATFKAMGEKTADERTQKARVALVIGKPDEAVQLYQANIKDNPKDIVSVQGLVQIYEARGQTDKVNQVVADALKQNPDHASLRLASLRLKNAKPAQIYAEIKPLIDKTPDEATRELQLAELERVTGGGMDKILPHIERAYQLRPTDRGNLQTLYSVYVARKDWAKAEPYLKELEKANADQVGGLLLRQEFLMAKGDLPGAEDLGRKLTEQYKELATSWMALAKAEHARGKYEEAAAHFAEVRRRDPRQYEALRLLVDCFYQVNRPEEAAAHLSQGRQLFPNDPALRELYLTHVVNYGNPADAIPDRKKLVDEKPDDSNSRWSLAVTYSRAAQRAGATDSAAAKEYLQSALDTALAGVKLFPDDSRFYDQAAEIHYYRGEGEKGETLLRQFATRESVRNKPLPLLLLSNFYLRQNKSAQAEKGLTDALAKADVDEAPEVRLRLAAVQTQQNKFPQALATLDGAADKADPRVALQRIEILTLSGDLKAAEAECDAALRKQDTPAVRNLRASILISTNRVPEALKELDASQKLDPRGDFTRFLHALALAKQPQPDPDGAVAELIQLGKRSPGYLKGRTLLAQLYFEAGKYEQGVGELTDTLQRVPQARDARLMLIRAYRSHKPPDDKSALALCSAADKDPVLRLDPVWGREAAMIFTGQRRTREALLTIDQVLLLAPDDVSLQRDRLDIIQLSGDYDAVIRESDKLLAKGLDFWWVRYQRGVAFGQRNDPDAKQAVAEFDKGLAFADAAKDGPTAELILRAMTEAVTRVDADGRRTAAGHDEAIRRVTPRLAIDPDSRWHALLVDFYRGKGDTANAGKVVEEMLADPANRPPARRIPLLRIAALVFHQSTPQNTARAKDVYTELLKLAGDDILALNNFACLLAEDINPPQPQQAKIYSTKAYELLRVTDSPNDVVTDTYGWVLTLCGGYDAQTGQNILKELAARRPDFIEAHYHLAESYLRQPNPNKELAVQELQQTTEVIRKLDAAGPKVDPQLKTKIQSTLERAGGKVSAPN